MARRPQKNSVSLSSPRVILICLLVVSLLCTIIYAREGESGVLHSIQNTCKVIASPFSRVGNSIDSGVHNVATLIGDTSADAETVSELKAQNAELREQAALLKEYAAEIERLSALLKFSDVNNIEGVTASVIGRSSEAWSQTITLNVGSDKGVRVGQTVMGPSGVVGEVIAVTPAVSTVRLLTDPQSGVAVLLQSNRQEGVVHGNLDGVLYLESVDANVNVQVGETLVTSGLGGSYVRGLIVGTVVRVDTSQGVASRRIIVSPNEDFGPLQEVMVIQSVDTSDLG